MVIEKMEKAFFDYIDSISDEDFEQLLIDAGIEDWPEAEYIPVKESKITCKDGQYSNKQSYKFTQKYNYFDLTGEVA